MMFGEKLRNGLMTDHENQLRAARFERPERIPVSCGLSASCYAHYPLGALDELKAG